MPDDKVLTPEQAADWHFQMHNLMPVPAQKIINMGVFLAAIDKVWASHETLRVQLATERTQHAETLDRLQTVDANCVEFERERDRALAQVAALRTVLESAPMPGVATLTGEEILAGDLHIACRNITVQYAGWWEKVRAPALASLAQPEVTP